MAVALAAAAIGGSSYGIFTRTSPQAGVSPAVAGKNNTGNDICGAAQGQCLIDPSTVLAAATGSPVPSAAQTHPNGAIVVFGNTTYVFAGGHAFAATPQELAALEKVDPAKVLTAPSGETPPTAAPRSGVLVTTNSVNGNGEIFVAGTDGELHGFATPAQLLSDGYDARLVVTITSLGGLKVGAPAADTDSALATKADGALVDSSGTLFTYAGGRAFEIGSQTSLQKIRPFNKAVVLNGAVPPADSSAPIADGVLPTVEPIVHVSSGGELFPFRSFTQLTDGGYGGTAGIPVPNTGGLNVVLTSPTTTSPLTPTTTTTTTLTPTTTTTTSPSTTTTSPSTTTTSPSTTTTSPVSPTKPVTINLVNINDYHGTIDQNTLKWAGTVEQAKALNGATPANTLFLSAGDNVGASTFPSAIADDQPTIEMLNELGLKASALGNHELDKGFDDLKDRIAHLADFPYIADNVFEKGTNTPALPQDARFTVGGLSVAVIGAVEEETTTLVSPAGIANIDIGPVIPSLNRVANELEDSADPPDVIVAEVHAGATQGQSEGSTLEQQVQIPGSFQNMVRQLSPRIDAIFNAHTHQVYAWQAPNPDAPAGWIKNRPILETGATGMNVGDVQLKIDPSTHALLSYTEENIPPSTAADSELISQFPALKQVQTTINDALANAAKVGNEPIGSITADITTAADNPSEPFNPKTNRDGRDQESTLGELVANALRDGIPPGNSELPRPDLGIVNPGGLRAELLFKGDTASNPANTDGVVTYGEANSVLPFVNGVSEVKLSGAALKKVLEEQWQPAGSSRPFLALGLSSNVHVLYDPDGPAGSHIKSVTIDGKPLDPSETYVVSTFSFLATGGDNFSSFTKGTAKDTGLVDRDLWIDYLRSHPKLPPSFAREEVGVTGLPDVVEAGDHLSLTFSNLNLTSSGSPKNKTLEVTATPTGGSPTKLDTVDVSEGMVGAVPGSVVTSSGGEAKVDLTVPNTLAKGGVLTFVAEPTGTTMTVDVAAASTEPPDNLVISEVYGGGGNTGAVFKDDFIELYNPTSMPLALDGLSLIYRSATGSQGGAAQPLTGTVPPHTHWLVQEAGGANTSLRALPAPDARGSLNLSGTAGQVLLVKGTTFSGQGDLAQDALGDPNLVDMVGWGPSTTSFEHAPAPATTNSTSISRDASGTDTNDNAEDFTEGEPDPQNSAGSAGALTVTPVADLKVPVGDPITPVTLAATGGTPPVTWSATGLPAGLKLSGDTISGTPSAAATSTVKVTATDSASPANQASFSFTVTAEQAQQHTIAQIQGTDTDVSPFAGQVVSTEGDVTADYKTGGFNGFYLETGGAGGTLADDKTPGASDAIFVYGSAAAQEVNIGESVKVTGEVAEFNGLTQITNPDVTKLSTPLPAVVPDKIPWSDLETNAEKEAHEGELMAPQGEFLVNDNYNINLYGEIGLAAGNQLLRQPTDVGPPGSQAAIDQVAYNAAHAVTLDDGSSTAFRPNTAPTLPLPWLTASTPVSDGARVTFHEDVVLDFRNNAWKFQPTSPVTGDGSAVATFSDEQTSRALPGNVGGKIRLATFNVQNYFPTTGEDFVASGGKCTWYDDRAGNHITVNTCTGADGSAGPRGAANAANFQRQQAKIVYGINHLGASIVSLEEVENSVKFGEDRDSAISGLVKALNAAAGPGTWAYAPSPPASDLPTLSEQDVIRSGFIYKPADVQLVGPSHVLTTASGPGQAFAIAREPLAQGFKARGAPDSDAFLVVVNHLKSKGAGTPLFSDCPNGGDTENTDPASNQGAFNCTRVHEVEDMLKFAREQAQALGTDRIFLAGDFNAYDHEDPIEYLLKQGFTDLTPKFDPTASTYAYGGTWGSLDHVLASPGAMSMVTGATVWQINSQESIAENYSRFNYSPTDLFDANSPWAASDHDPEVVGLNPPGAS